MKINSSKIRMILFSIGLVLLGFATYLLLTPSVGKTPSLFPHMDKVLHFLIHFGFGSWFAQLTSRKKSGCSIALWGVAIEMIQPYTGRSFDWFDLLANNMGLLIALKLFDTSKGYLHWFFRHFTPRKCG